MPTTEPSKHPINFLYLVSYFVQFVIILKKVEWMKLELDDIKDKLEITVEENEQHEIKEQADDNSKRCQKCF